MNRILFDLLDFCEKTGASDIHVSVGLEPRFRILNALLPKGNFPKLDSEAVDAIAIELGLHTLPVGVEDGPAKVLSKLEKNHSIDGALTSESGTRFRFNVYCESSRHAIALRRLDSEFRSFSSLGLPQRLIGFCDEPDGLVIVSGPTGSGKSTTLATMIDHVNHTRDGHIVTIEDPVEYVHESDRCLVSQRQVGRDAVTFNDALVESLRQDPDVILVGEIRDTDTVRTALRAAETGHLVFATLHAGDCAGAIERLVSVFPSEEQNSVRHQLALVLRGICAQHLLTSPMRNSRHPACEILVNTSATANLIATGRTQQLYSSIETGSAYGMRTLDQSLLELYAAGKLDARIALALSRNPEILKGRLNAVTK